MGTCTSVLWPPPAQDALGAAPPQAQWGERRSLLPSLGWPDLSYTFIPLTAGCHPGIHVPRPCPGLSQTVWRWWGGTLGP